MTQLPFIPDHFYHRRNDIHAKYGGNWQSGISPSASRPFIFIFTGSSGHQHGYRDGWDNPNVFSYTGEGQLGDMTFTKGNLALRDHKENGKRVFLFEQHKKGYVKFLSEVEVIDIDLFETPDRNFLPRVGIKFTFKRQGIFLPYRPELLNPPIDLVADPLGLFPLETQKERFVNTRVGQGAYRKRIIHRWEYKCAVTGFDHLQVLVASHIIPWAESDDNQRIDVNNGILLSPTYDALFDRNLITFENSGKIILSDAVEMEAFNKIGVSGHESIKNLSEYNHTYLDSHRNRFLSI
ncbi:MAG: HNH endonuclease [Flavobacterium sp.]|nr:HNH endonuclease [Flavobacterium sp.]